MAAFISFSTEEEQALDLAKYLNKLQTKGKEANESFHQECAKLLLENKANELVNKLLDEHVVLFAEGNEKDIEGFFLVLISICKKFAQGDQIITKIVTILTSNAEDKSLLRLRILNNLYNITEKQALRYTLYLAIIKYAFASRNADVVIKEFPSQLSNRIREWGVTTDQIRNVYKLIRDSYRESGRSAESYQWGVKFLSTYEGPDASQLQEAVITVLEAIKLPSHYQFDSLLDFPLVKQLEGSPHGKIFQLLKIFVGENLDSFRTFHAENADYLKSQGLKEEECTLKMRLLSLASLGVANQEVPYSLIAKTLQIEETEVEYWIITAMSEEVLEAKMDQLRKVVVISRCLQRVFVKAQWKQLSDNLSLWRNNTKNLLKTLQETKQQFRLAAKGTKV